MAQAYVEVPLGGKKAAGRVALIDIEDYELVSLYSWCIWELERPGGRKSGPYAVTSMLRVDGLNRQIRMHQLITGRSGVDHVNHNGLDNTRENLRAASISQNGQNMRTKTTSASGFKGVYRDQRRSVNPWRAYITIGGRRAALGCFPGPLAAARAYDAAAQEAFGEYACLNFPA